MYYLLGHFNPFSKIRDLWETQKTIHCLKCVSKNIKSDAQSSLHFLVSHLISCLSNTVAC